MGRWCLFYNPIFSYGDIMVILLYSEHYRMCEICRSDSFHAYLATTQGLPWMLMCVPFLHPSICYYHPALKIWSRTDSSFPSSFADAFTVPPRADAQMWHLWIGCGTVLLMLQIRGFLLSPERWACWFIYFLASEDGQIKAALFGSWLSALRCP